MSTKWFCRQFYLKTRLFEENWYLDIELFSSFSQTLMIVHCILCLVLNYGLISGLWPISLKHKFPIDHYLYWSLHQYSHLMVGRGVVGRINWECCLRCVCVVSVSVLYLCCVCVCVVLCCVCVVGRINWECCLLCSPSAPWLWFPLSVLLCSYIFSYTKYKTYLCAIHCSQFRRNINIGVLLHKQKCEGS